MGFEASGVVADVGPHVKNWKIGDRITTIVSSGGYAEYATADASLAIPIPDEVSFAEAATIPVQGISAGPTSLPAQGQVDAVAPVAPPERQAVLRASA